MRWSVVMLIGLAACGDAGPSVLGTGGAPNTGTGPAGGEEPGPGTGTGTGTGTGVDGGAVGDATTALPTPAPDAAVSCVVCDGFEQSAVGQPPGSPWSLSTPSCSGSGAIAVDDTRAHGGKRSVKVTGAGGYCNHVFFAALAAVRPVTWIRFFVQLDTPLGDGHTTFLAMHDAHDNKDLRMGGQKGVLMFNRETDDATLPEMSPAGVALSVSPAAGAWTCVEVAIDQTAKTIHTWVNGAEVPGLVDDGVATPDVDAQWLRGAWAPSLTDTRFGWESYAGQAETLWFDDVAIGNARFGCGG